MTKNSFHQLAIFIYRYKHSLSLDATTTTLNFQNFKVQKLRLIMLIEIWWYKKSFTLLFFNYKHIKL